MAQFLVNVIDNGDVIATYPIEALGPHEAQLEAQERFVRENPGRRAIGIEYVAAHRVGAG